MTLKVPEGKDPCGCSAFPCLQRLPSPARFVQTTATTFVVLLHLPATADWDCDNNNNNNNLQVFQLFVLARYLLGVPNPSPVSQRALT